jgi:hypothetical protein
MADPTTITCTSACTVTLVHQFDIPLLSLSPEEGAQISSAILLVWAAGWAFRVLIQALRTSDGNPSTED